ncbi:MAG TPA: GIY-YIG nuclease family protein [bacterium]|nr:GIY-YIG nuclease family protein [bacterium]HPN46123.1 GIY-YIG nuclease family protein [bacterium]
MDNSCFYVYVLLLKNGKRYTGQTNNLSRRLEEHQNGRSPYTRMFKMEKLLFSQQFPTRSDAVKFERFLKTTSGRKWLDQSLAEESTFGG